MYSQFFGLRSNPFSTAPPSNDYSYLPFSHRIIMRSLNKDLYKTRGLLLLCGAVGVGKSTLAKDILENYDQKNGNVVFRDLTPQIHLQLLESRYSAMILNSFSDVSLSNKDNKKTIVFLLDSFDNLSHSFLKTLLNKVTESNQNSQPTVLILTAGIQLEKELKVLQEGLSFSLATRTFVLKSFESHQVKNYIQHRLFAAGYSSKPLFSDKAIQLITQLSSGIPRIINNICSLSIFQASSDHLSIIDETSINHATEFLLLSNRAEIKKNMNLDETDSEIKAFNYQLEHEISIMSHIQEEIPKSEVQNKKIVQKRIKRGHSIKKLTKIDLSSNKLSIIANNLTQSSLLQQKNTDRDNLINEIDDSDSIIITPKNHSAKPLFLKRMTDVIPLVFLFVFLIWINPENIKPVEFLSNTHSDNLNSSLDSVLEDKIEIEPQYPFTSDYKLGNIIPEVENKKAFSIESEKIFLNREVVNIELNQFVMDENNKVAYLKHFFDGFVGNEEKQKQLSSETNNMPITLLGHLNVISLSERQEINNF